METFKHLRISERQKRVYAVAAINIAFGFYEDGDVESAAILLGFCEECTHNFFDDLGVNDLAGDFSLDMDDDNKVFVLPADHNEEDEYEDIFDERDRFDTLFSA